MKPLALVFCIFCIPLTTLAHPYHTSVTEIRLNPDSQTLEIALRLLPEALEDAISARLKKSFIVGPSKTVDQHIVKYLWEFFRVTNEQGQRLELNWVGKEVSHAGAWLYFEMPLEGAHRLMLQQRVLMDWQVAQVNTVKFTDGTTTTSLSFDLTSKEQLLWQHL